MGYIVTRPDAEQLKFVSAKTGVERTIDEYLEAAERPGKSLPDMVNDLFDESGVLRAVATPTDVATAVAKAAEASASAASADASAAAAAASAASIASGPVSSVNGKVGVVSLVPADVGAQAALVSGTNIKTVGGQSLLGSGDVPSGLVRVEVSGTTQTCVSGNDYWAENVAATAFTAPSAADGARFAVTPANSLKTNTVNFGAATVSGPGGTTTGTVTLDLGRAEFMYSAAKSAWVML